MSGSPLQTDPAGIAQLLDEHHLVVLGQPARRRTLGTTLSRSLRALPGTRVVEIGGPEARDLSTIVEQLAEGLDHAVALHAGVPQLVETLRGLPGSMQRIYVLWHDADVLLDSDPVAFAQCVNAALGIAAEREHVSRDELVLERWVFLGGPRLGAYAEDSRGQFRSWLEEDGATLFWDVATVVKRPHVLTVRLDG